MNCNVVINFTVDEVSSLFIVSMDTCISLHPIVNVNSNFFLKNGAVTIIRFTAALTVYTSRNVWVFPQLGKIGPWKQHAFA